MYQSRSWRSLPDKYALRFLRKRRCGELDQVSIIEQDLDCGAGSRNFSKVTDLKAVGDVYSDIPVEKSRIPIAPFKPKPRGIK